MLPTYNIRITNLRTKEVIDLSGNKEGLAHITPPLQGFGQPDIRTSQYVFSGADGGSIDEQFYGMRQIPIDFFIHSMRPEEMQSQMALADRVLSIRDKLRVELSTPAGRRYQTVAQLTEPADPKIEWPFIADYNIRLVSGDHRLYDFTDGVAQRVVLELQKSGGLLWSDNGILWSDDGIRWQDGGDDPIAYNEGNTHVWPVITLRGRATNPSVTNKTTRQTIAISVTMGPLDTIVIDTFNRETTFNGQNIENNLELAEYLRLDPGVNEMLLSSTGAGDTVTAEVEWHNAYTGVS